MWLVWWGMAARPASVRAQAAGSGGEGRLQLYIPTNTNSPSTPVLCQKHTSDAFSLVRAIVLLLYFVGVVGVVFLLLCCCGFFIVGPLKALCDSLF